MTETPRGEPPVGRGAFSRFLESAARYTAQKAAQPPSPTAPPPKEPLTPPATPPRFIRPDLDTQYSEDVPRRIYGPQQFVSNALPRYGAEAKKINLQPVQSGVWILTDGILYSFPQFNEPPEERIHRISLNDEALIREVGFDFAKRVEHVGQFTTNNSVLAFVNEKGELFVGVANEENKQALEVAGYKGNRDVSVPFSNGEEPINQNLRWLVEQALYGDVSEIPIEAIEPLAKPPPITPLETVAAPLPVEAVKGRETPYALVRSHWAIDKGDQRKNNEDYAASWEPATPELRMQLGENFDQKDQEELSRGNIYVVADGVGGAAYGEIASREATRVVINALSTSPQQDSIVALTEALQIANESVRQKGHELGKRIATTCTIALIRERELYVANLGDSRAYLLRGDEFKRLTDDHSWVAAIERRERTLEEYQSSRDDRRGKTPRLNEIYQSLWGQQNIDLSTVIQGPIFLQQGDKLLLCTDGLWGPVPEGTIRQVLEISQNPQEASRRLVVEALENGGPDNIGVLVVEISEFGSQPQTPIV